jgi:FkbH-like protein
MDTGVGTKRPGLWGRLLGKQPAEATAPASPAPAAPGAAFRALFDGAQAGDERPEPRAQAEEQPAPLLRAPQPHAAPHAPLVQAPFVRIAAADYLTPTDLRPAGQEAYRAVAIGSCFLEALLSQYPGNPQGPTFDFRLVNGIREFPETPPAPLESYACQLVQLPLRSVMHDLMFRDLRYDDLAAYEKELGNAKRTLDFQLKSRMKWNIDAGKLTFVMNFPTPQFHPVGRLHSKFDLRNIEYFVMMLNQELERLVVSYKNAFVLDVDRIVGSLGKRFVQDDLIGQFNHGSFLPAGSRLGQRIEELGMLGDHYEVTPLRTISDAVVAELDAMYRTTQQKDSVKLVVVDLDDTVWRGVLGETADYGPHMLEGWPLGMAEALNYVRSRGILLAILSKNDDAHVRAAWDKIFSGRLKLEDFCDARINWQPKHENMAEILRAVNLLPRNVLFIDDNPVERARMKEAFPDMRIIGGNAYHTRRILLLAPELQVATITQESAARTAMVQSQILREADRATVSMEDFAREQNVQITLAPIRSCDHAKFPRALELINKTNQFNTTGRRWTSDECAELFKEGGLFAVYEVQDRYTPYGLVGVAIITENQILQWVMSCRVIGLGVERAVLHTLVNLLRQAGARRIRADLVQTPVNLPCQSVFPDAGFVEKNGRWVLDQSETPEMPPFVTLDASQMST